MEQLDILRCAFSANAKIKFVSNLWYAVYSVLWENQPVHFKNIVFFSITMFYLTVVPNSRFAIHYRYISFSNNTIKLL
ncbi:Uncharacterized protein APZ42_005363 [Daphnia magna]|uniref:Uncharacterized protein n=1 Tax=Daphnia magna TaxID=35525 RepID=A0A162CTK6_9CRUS|nr:Uncharacterized protein APZ42_005363 [Daphnia magna]